MLELRKATIVLATAAAICPGLSAGIRYVPAFLLTGESTEWFGGSVAGAGDVNGDGHGDVMVRATDGATDTVRVFSGADGSLLLTIQEVFGHPLLGVPMAGVGDVDGDGKADLALGTALDAGFVRILSGSDGSELAFIGAPRGVSGFGAAVGAAGDINGDGVGDIVVGHVAFNSADIVVVLSGADGSVLRELTVVEDKFGPIALGSAVDGAGEVNGDGIDDLIVGALNDGPIVLHPGVPPFLPPFEFRQPNGSARVYSGADGSELFRFLASERGDLEGVDGFGYSVSGAGDVNNDGRDDVIVGTLSIDTDRTGVGGFARVFCGVDGSTLYSFLDESQDGPFDTFVTVDGMGDVDGDGHADVLVASTETSPSVGHVRIFSGKDGSIIFAHEYASADLSRISASNCGDVNGDGLSDLVVGSFGPPAPGLESGFAEVWVSYRTARSPDLNGDGKVDGADLGLVLSAWGGTAADLDGDGVTNGADLGILLAEWTG